MKWSNLHVDDESEARPVWLWSTRARASTQSSLQQQLGQLPDRQLSIYQRLKSSKRRHEYLYSRLLICSALSSLFPQPPANGWQIEEQPGRAPSLDGLPIPLHLSLSHSQELICLTLSPIRVGVDVEFMKPERNFREAAKLFMTAAELRRQPTRQSACRDYFYRLWCAKEAQYKALPPEQQKQIALREIDFQALHQAGRPGN